MADRNKKKRINERKPREPRVMKDRKSHALVVALSADKMTISHGMSSAGNMELNDKNVIVSAHILRAESCRTLMVPKLDF